MSRIAGVMAAAVVTAPACAPAPPEVAERTTPAGDSLLAEAFRTRRSNLEVEGEGTVVRILPDDTRGSRHQRFLVELASGQTLLIAHNIDVSRRVEALEVGDRIRFAGEYEWNERGGVLHWTHRDEDGSHPDGWLLHAGRRYW